MSVLYKFVRSVSAVEGMLRGDLRFSTVSELNDPCELLDEIDEELVVQSLKHMRRVGYSDSEFFWLQRQAALLAALAPESQAIPLPLSPAEAHRQVRSSFYDDVERMARLQRQAVLNIRGSSGILSLTSRYDSLPMWAHYADNARGFVVIFKDLERAFPGDETGVLNQVKSVSYSDEFRGMTFVPSTQNDLFFWKHADWSYEAETRVVSALNMCRLSEVGSTQMHLRAIDCECIRGVILGWNVDDAVKADITRTILTAGRPVDLYQAQIARVSVIIHRIDLST